MSDLFTVTALSILAAGFFVGIVVGLTGMGGGALMTPALIFLGVGNGAAATVVTADLTAAAVYKSGGALVHAREGSPNFALAKWLVLGSVPMAFLGPWLVHHVTSDKDQLDTVLKEAIGFALLLAAVTYALRIYINLRRSTAPGAEAVDRNPPVRPIPTLLVGALGGLLVGVTSVGSGSVIMIALLMLYPGLPAVKLVGTDLVQAVPLVAAASVGHILFGDFTLGLTGSILVGAIPGVWLGARVSSHSPGSLVRRALTVVLLASGIKLLGGSTGVVLGITGGAVVLGAVGWAWIRVRHGEAPLVVQERHRRAAAAAG
jgi:uncharacterized protein